MPRLSAAQRGKFLYFYIAVNPKLPWGRRMNSQREPLSAPEPRLSVPTADSRGNSNDACSNPRPINAKIEHGILNDAADQSGTVVMIGSPVAAPYLYFPVHNLCAAAKREATSTA